MSEEGPKSSIEEWIKAARKDWERAKRNLREEDTDAAGFYLQQSLEKYLKAFLLQYGWPLVLDALLDEAVKYDSNLKSFYELCERVSGYYLADRYPPLGGLGLTCEELKNDLAEARTFIKTLFPKEELT